MMALTEEQARAVGERRSYILATVYRRFSGEAFRTFLAMDENRGARLRQHQMGLWKLAIYGDRAGEITETYDEVGEGQITTVRVTTENAKMLLTRSEGGWWEYIKAELDVDPLILIDRADNAEFVRTRFDERLFRTVRTVTPWTFQRINGMPGYGGIAELNDLAIGKALGIVGGIMPHEQHPVQAARTEVLAGIGQPVEGQLTATSGIAPYTFAADGILPIWIVIGSDGAVVATPPPGTAIGKIEIDYIVTDASGAEASGVLVIDVVDV